MELEVLYLSSSLNRMIAKESDIEPLEVLDFTSSCDKVISEKSSKESLLNFDSSRVFTMDFNSELFEIEE
jgi:hypothetical protein